MERNLGRGGDWAGLGVTLLVAVGAYFILGPDAHVRVLDTLDSSEVSIKSCS